MDGTPHRQTLGFCGLVYAEEGIPEGLEWLVRTKAMGFFTIITQFHQVVTQFGNAFSFSDSRIFFIMDANPSVICHNK